MLALFGLLTGAVLGGENAEFCAKREDGKIRKKFNCMNTEGCYWNAYPPFECRDTPPAPLPCGFKSTGAKCTETCCKKKDYCAWDGDSCEDACHTFEGHGQCANNPMCEYNPTTDKCVPYGTVPCNDILTPGRCNEASQTDRKGARPKGCLFNHAEPRLCVDDCQEMTKGYSCKRTDRCEWNFNKLCKPKRD